MASFDSSDLPKERLRFSGLMGGSGRPEYKDSDPPTCFTNHCHVAQSWPLNHERLRFSQNSQLSHALIYCKLISSSNQCSVNRKSQLFLHKTNFKPILTDLKVFRLPESKFDLELRKINIFPNKHIKIHKIKYI